MADKDVRGTVDWLHDKGWSLKLRGDANEYFFSMAEYRNKEMWHDAKVGDYVYLGVNPAKNGKIYVEESKLLGEQAPTIPEEIPFGPTSPEAQTLPGSSAPMPEPDPIPGKPKETSDRIDTSVDIKEGVNLAMAWAHKFESFDDMISAALHAYDRIHEHIR